MQLVASRKIYEYRLQIYNTAYFHLQNLHQHHLELLRPKFLRQVLRLAGHSQINPINPIPAVIAFEELLGNLI